MTNDVDWLVFLKQSQLANIFEPVNAIGLYLILHGAPLRTFAPLRTSSACIDFIRLRYYCVCLHYYAAGYVLCK